MKISIALCTRNGEKFLRTQLASLVDQTLAADEIIVCDEGSTDQTLDILEQFKNKLPLKIHVNPERLGTFRNFEKAFSLCTGDIVFPADQDDYWDPQKLERISEHFKMNPETNVVFSDAILVDEFGRKSETRLWQTFRFREEQQKQWKEGKALEILLDGNRVTGCTMGVRKTFLDRILPFPSNIPSTILHDAYIAFLGALGQSIDFLPAAYVHYRLHSQQQVGVKGNLAKAPSLLDRINRPHFEKTKPYIEKLVILEELQRVAHQFNPQVKFEPLETKILYYSRRGFLPKARWKRLKKTLENLLSGNYHRFQDIDSKSFLQPYLMFLGDLIE
ncbi:glycosyltransferase family 2 protein [Aquirufa sp. ROCK2-A2]